MLYIILRGCWCNIIILKVHTTCKNKSDELKDSFYEKERHVLDQFPRYDLKMLGDFNEKVGRYFQTKNREWEFTQNWQ
jgi:hypothetical protein